MNMRVSHDAIEHAAAMMNISTPMRDIIAMFEGKLKPTEPVIKLRTKLLTGEYVEPPKDVPLRAAGAGAPKKIRDVKTRAEAQLGRRPYKDSVQPILNSLQGCTKPALEISEELKVTRTMIQHVLERMAKEGHLSSQLVRGGVRTWFLVGYTDDLIESFKAEQISYKEAKDRNFKHYDASPCNFCNATKRITQTRKCVECEKAHAARAGQKRLGKPRGNTK